MYKVVVSTLVRVKYQGPVVQSIVSLTSSLRIISLTVLADSIYNILIFFAEKCEFLHCKSYSHFFSKNFQHICLSLNVNFNESLTNDIVSFEQLGPELLNWSKEFFWSYPFNFHLLWQFWFSWITVIRLWPWPHGVTGFGLLTTRLATSGKQRPIDVMFLRLYAP